MGTRWAGEGMAFWDFDLAFWFGGGRVVWVLGVRKDLRELRGRYWSRLRYE